MTEGKIKILYVIERLARAGTELHLLKVLQNLNRDRFEPVLCCLSREMTDAALLPDEDMQTHLLDGQWNLLRPSSLRLFRQLRGVIQKERPDVVHSFLFVANVMAPYAAKGRCRPAIVVSRGRMGIEWNANILHKIVQRRADQISDAILCKTEAMRHEIARHEKVTPEKIYVIPNGVDLRRFKVVAGSVVECRQILQAQFGVSEEGALLLAVGNLKPIKGHQTLIEALDILKPDFPRLQVAIIGSGESESILREEITSRHLEPVVHLPGAQEDVRPWMAAADMFVAPSHSEGQPNALLEAMAMGLPCILSDIPGHREAIANDAWYFPPRDPRSLALRIREALEAPNLRAERGNAGRRRVREALSLEVMVERIQNIYTQLCTKVRP